MFYFPGYALHESEVSAEAEEFPHSEIFGSKVARHLTEAYRSYAPSFIAILCQGIHHMLLNFLLGNLKTTFVCYLLVVALLVRLTFSICLHCLKRPHKGTV